MTAPPPPTASELRRAPSKGALTVLCAAITPGSRVGAVRRLPGGISSGMHAVELVGPNDERRQVVVRRYGAGSLRADPRVAEREWSTLMALARVGAPTPRPLWSDSAGSVFGCPTIVTSRLPGHGLLAPRDPSGWIRQLAEALARIHATSLVKSDLELLLPQREDLAQLLDRDAPPPRLANEPDGGDVWSAMRRWWPRVDGPISALVHGDYWPGNTLWRYGRLSGVVDWEQARWGNPIQDVAYCRLDLTFLLGPDAADTFIGAYQTATGRVVELLFFWDLHAVTWALGELQKWVMGYHDLGRTDIGLDVTLTRLARFSAEALARAERGP